MILNLLMTVKNYFVAMCVLKCFVEEMEVAEFTLWLARRSTMLQTKEHLVSSSQLLCCIEYCMFYYLAY
jgi:hypothetical protein